MTEQPMPADQALINYAAGHRTVTADGLAPYLAAVRAEATAELTAQRDLARDTAVAPEQENARLQAELALVGGSSYSARHIWTVWREDQPIHAHYSTLDDARTGSIDCWEEDEPVCPDYSWKPDGPRLELVVGGEAGGVYISRADVFGTVFDAEKELAEARAERAKYVGAEPTIAEEMAELSRRIDSVLGLCDEQDKAARLFELPTPEWIGKVREAADGEWTAATPRPALPWAHVMDAGDLHEFLGDLVSAAMGRWRSEPEVPDRTVLADLEKVCADWRTPGQGLRSDEPGTGEVQ